MNIKRGNCMIQKIKILKNEIDQSRLEKCAEIAKKGIEFSEMYQEVIVYDNLSDYKDPQFIWLKNAEGRDLKGTVICSKPIKNDGNNFVGNSETKELYLMEDGTFKVFMMKATWSNLLDEENRYVRQVAFDQDISCFDYCEIIENIAKELEKRLKKLGKRTKAQTARIEKLQKLKIS